MRLPLLMTTPDEWAQVAKVVRPVLAAELERRGLVLLAHYRTAAQLFWSRLKAAGFIDIARQKLRVQSVEQAEFVRHYGGVHVFTSTVEAGEAMQAGKLDGAFATAAFVARAWRPLLKHAYLAGPNYNDAVIVANQEALRRLPDGLEPILKAAAIETEAWMATAQDQEEAQVLRQLGGEGLKTTPVSKEELQDGIQKLPSYWDSWVRLRGPEMEGLLVSVRQMLDR
jgi:TRAP-type C4-dicarboxylate transport system substrate-binding protein